MANSPKNPPKLFFSIIFFTFFSTMIFSKTPNPLNLDLDLDLDLRSDPDSLKEASRDYGNLLTHQPQNPHAVLFPSSENDVVEFLKLANALPAPFPVAARGRGHSVRGQAAAPAGVVVDMPSLAAAAGRIRVLWDAAAGYFADVGGEQMWIDVLRAGLEHGLAPVSWTDYLHLTVGGTLSNGGISGQASRYGPQISNVLEMDVVTGKGDLLTCSETMNSELFFAVLGGLGQFGIITRARIILHKAPNRAKWVRLIYDDFSKFTSDQEHLMMNGPNYVEGSIITDKSPPNNWRSSSFYKPSHQTKIQSLLKNNGGILYSLELVKYYTTADANNIHQEVELMVKDLSFVPGFAFKRDVPFFDFLYRVGSLGEKNEEEAHPWLNLFLPKSQIMDFNNDVFLNIIRMHNQTSGPILFYPLHRQKWDDRTSAVLPEDEDDIFYTLGLLHSTKRSESHIFDNLNKEILQVCERNGIRIKQYLAHYESKEDWILHFGSKWNTFQERKEMFDPRMILSPGQRIFTADVMESDF